MLSYPIIAVPVKVLFISQINLFEIIGSIYLFKNDALSIGFIIC